MRYNIRSHSIESWIFNRRVNSFDKLTESDSKITDCNSYLLSAQPISNIIYSIFITYFELFIPYFEFFMSLITFWNGKRGFQWECSDNIKYVTSETIHYLFQILKIKYLLKHTNYFGTLQLYVHTINTSWYWSYFVPSRPCKILSTNIFLYLMLSPKDGGIMI